MATFSRFEEIDAWKGARALSYKVFELFQRDGARHDYGLRDQINRSLGSVMDNIAEGFERGGNREFIQFLSIAKGSAGEVRSQLYRMADRRYVSQEEFDKLTNDLTGISKQLSGLISYLRSSELKGPKYHEPEEPYGNS
jgi:four helix bundle protein